jgi:hypothetical protein
VNTLSSAPVAPPFAVAAAVPPAAEAGLSVPELTQPLPPSDNQANQLPAEPKPDSATSAKTEAPPGAIRTGSRVSPLRQVAPAAATSAPPPLVIPAPVVLEYDVVASRKGLSFHASGTLHWQRSPEGYDARMDIKALFVGTRTQTSVGGIDPVLGLQPRRFGDKNRSEQAAHFDRTQNPPVIRFSANTPDAPLQPQSQDRLSVLMQLAGLLGGAPRGIRPGLAFTLHTAGPRDAEDWRFTVEDTQPLDLPAGRLAAVHLLRVPSQPYDNRVEVWMAPSLGYMPARILWTQANGDVVDQRLTGHSP